MSNTTNTTTSAGTTTAATTSNTGKKQIGHFVQLGGVGAFAVGAILSLHHVAIAAAFLGGAAAFYIGHKITAA
jgi:hypothetical protein